MMITLEDLKIGEGYELRFDEETDEELGLRGRMLPYLGRVWKFNYFGSRIGVFSVRDDDLSVLKGNNLVVALPPRRVSPEEVPSEIQEKLIGGFN